MTEIIHACPPDGSGLTPCCGKTPFELPLGDRISSEAFTCTGATPTPPVEHRPVGVVAAAEAGEAPDCSCGNGTYPHGPAPQPEPVRRDQYAALFRSPPGEVRLGDEPPGTIADAVMAVADQEHTALKRAHVALAEQAGKDQAALERVRKVTDLIAAGAPWTSSREDTARRIRDAIEQAE